MVTPLYVSFMFMVLAMLSVLAAGVFISSRSNGTFLKEEPREVLLWGGGFIVYAILDYFILMG